MSKVLLTGAGGFTGRHLAPRLAAEGYLVHGLAHSLDDGVPEGVHQMHEADLADPQSVVRVVNAVTELAWDPSVSSRARYCSTTLFAGSILLPS